MDDYISRKSVTVGLDYIINGLNKLITDDPPNDVYTDIKNQVEEIKRGVLNIPSAQPRKNGKWIVTSEFEDCRYVKCNQCKVTQVFYYNKPLTNFCPNCGADMRTKEIDCDYERAVE